MKPHVKDKIISKTKYLEHVMRTVTGFNKIGKMLNPRKQKAIVNAHLIVDQVKNPVL